MSKRGKSPPSQRFAPLVQAEQIARTMVLLLTTRERGTLPTSQGREDVNPTLMPAPRVYAIAR